MISNRLLLATVVFLLSSFAVPDSANAGQDAWQAEASALYASGDYDQAYKKYLKLGKKGDRFSAYRISYMSLKGQGTKADVIESLAWAVLAAQDGQEDLISYKDAVAALVPEDKRKKAQQKVDYYVRRWGDDDDEGTLPPPGDCTGSRLSANCNPESSQKAWIYWKRTVPTEQELEEQIEELNHAIVSSAGGLGNGSAGS